MQLENKCVNYEKLCVCTLVQYFKDDTLPRFTPFVRKASS